MHSSSCDCRQPDAFPPGGDEVFETLRALLRDGGDYPGIRCPRCFWQPKQESRWWCLMECGCTWNTFDTHGQCPRCARVWEVTACLRCSVFSAHEAWYVDANPRS